MVTEKQTYGFVHDGKIYLNPDLMNENAAVHEYTHLWDAYTDRDAWETDLNENEVSPLISVTETLPLKIFKYKYRLYLFRNL